MVTDFFNPHHYTYSFYALPTFLTTAATSLLAVFTLSRERKSAERKKFPRNRPMEMTPAFAAHKILETMNGAVFVLDRQGIIRVVNRSACEMLGYAESELMGRALRAVEPLGDRQDGRPFDFKSLDLHDKVMEWKTKDGRRIDVSVSSSLLTDRDQSPAGLVCVAMDITEKKRAQEELIKKTVELARANAEREQLELFTYVASHDLSAPLQKIVGFGDLLKMASAGTLPAKAGDYLERMQAAARRMARLIDDLLKFSRLTLAKAALQPVSLEEVVVEVLSDLELPIHQLKAQITVGPLPAVQADRAEMLHLFQNLISNALKFRKKGVPLKVAVSARPVGGDEVEVTVSDNGIGFDEHELQRLFKPFERLHSQADYDGSGLGLAICHKIVEHHGGAITAKSAPSQGASFLITLPRRIEEVSAVTGSREARCL